MTYNVFGGTLSLTQSINQIHPGSTGLDTWGTDTWIRSASSDHCNHPVTKNGGSHSVTFVMPERCYGFAEDDDRMICSYMVLGDSFLFPDTLP